MLAGALLLRPFVPHRPAIVYDAFELYAVMESRKYPKRVVRLLGYLERQLPRRATAVITPGESRQRYFEERGISSTVVSNWIDPPISAPRRVNARQQLGVQDAFCVAYIGGIQRSRDLEPLIEHARRTPSTVVLIAGRGDNEEPVRTAVAGLSNVRLLGWVSEPAYLYAAADSLYYAIRTDHPYASFAAPNNLYAAIAMAIPLIYRPQGELAIVGGRSRIGVPFSDQVSLDRAVETLREPRTNRAIRAELKKLRTTYSWAAARDALLDLYERIGTTRSRARANGP
jgi:glycosyltransferase involved in cell wall biosynthesis